MNLKVQKPYIGHAGTELYFPQLILWNVNGDPPMHEQEIYEVPGKVVVYSRDQFIYMQHNQSILYPPCNYNNYLAI